MSCGTMTMTTSTSASATGGIRSSNGDDRSNNSQNQTSVGATTGRCSFLSMMFGQRRPPWRLPTIDAMHPHNHENATSSTGTTTSRDKAHETKNLCVICQDALSAPIMASIPCGHCFHEGCCRQWIKQSSSAATSRTTTAYPNHANNKKCPLCSKPSRSFHKLYIEMPAHAAEEEPEKKMASSEKQQQQTSNAVNGTSTWRRTGVTRVTLHPLLVAVSCVWKYLKSNNGNSDPTTTPPSRDANRRSDGAERGPRRTPTPTGSSADRDGASGDSRATAASSTVILSSWIDACKTFQQQQQQQQPYPDLVFLILLILVVVGNWIFPFES